MLLTRIVLLCYLMRRYLPGTHAMVMFSSDANVRCCFRRLGIERGSSDRQQIKQAFRRLAHETHPDRFTNPIDKERATVAFRELYKTYQEALTAESSGSVTPEQNQNARRTTDSSIRKAFQDICDELDRSSDAYQRESWSQLTRSVQEAWPDRDLTWKIVSPSLTYEIDELVTFFEIGSDEESDDSDVVAARLAAFVQGRHEKLAAANAFNLKVQEDGLAASAASAASAARKAEREERADISHFLREKVAQRRLENYKKYDLKYDQWARYIEDHWPDADADADTTLLKEWAKTTWTLFHYELVAKRVRVKFPLAATTIMDWETERSLNIKQDCAEELKQSAKDIIQVYPDCDAISTIVNRHKRSERQELYNLLPETIRLALQGFLHLTGEPAGLHLELEGF
jgi:hypothetical protein